MHHVDLLATFVELGGGTPSSLESYDLDSVSQWQAIAGEGTSPRDELVLNLPRSTKWKLGDASSDGQGVALRVGKYKLLLNHVYDGWFAPVDAHLRQMAFKKINSCDYGTYSVGTNVNCTFENFLFDLDADPFEETNLWGETDLKDIQASLISRAEELAESQGNYGSILQEFNIKRASKSNSSYLKDWEANDWYVSPFGCEVIP